MSSTVEGDDLERRLAAMEKEMEEEGKKDKTENLTDAEIKRKLQKSCSGKLTDLDEVLEETGLKPVPVPPKEENKVLKAKPEAPVVVSKRRTWPFLSRESVRATIFGIIASLLTAFLATHL